MKSYSMDLWERVLQDCDGGMETRPVAVKVSGERVVGAEFEASASRDGRDGAAPCRNRWAVARGIVKSDSRTSNRKT